MDFIPAEALGEALRSGRVLYLYELHALVRYAHGICYVSLPNCTQRLREQDFLSLYGSWPAVYYEPQPDIDEQKDEAYYAWRREKQ